MPNATTDLPGEEWRPTPSFPLYEASNQGRVRRAKGGQGARAGRLLTPQVGKGYATVRVHGGGGKGRTKSVHLLVADAFLAPPPGPRGKTRGTFQVNHIDAAKDNNRPANLEWVTPAANMQHAARLGLFTWAPERRPRPGVTEIVDVVCCVCGTVVRRQARYVRYRASRGRRPCCSPRCRGILGGAGPKPVPE